MVVAGLGEVEEDTRRQRESDAEDSPFFLASSSDNLRNRVEELNISRLLSSTKVIELSSFIHRLVELPSFQRREGVRLITLAPSTSCNVTFRRPLICGHPSGRHDLYHVGNIFRDRICLQMVTTVKL